MLLAGRGLIDGSSSKKLDLGLSVGGAALATGRGATTPATLGNGGGVLTVGDPLIYILLLLGGAITFAVV